MERVQLFIHIRFLWGVHPANLLRVEGEQMSDLPMIENAWLKVLNGKILGVGRMSDINLAEETDSTIIDLQGKSILPAWCDSHTHLVFAATREEEFLQKIEGKSYEEIAASGGGILNSALKLQSTPEDVLYEQAAARLSALVATGTGAIEIKSGYGLSVEGELKMLRVIKRLKQSFQIPIRTTFLGAHAYPTVFKNDHPAYIRLIIEEMLPNIAAEGLADYIDVFCEQGFFSLEETKQIVEAGQKFGLKPKLHVNQLSNNGGVQLGVAMNALSLDHLEEIGQAEIEVLKGKATMATLLPGCSFFLGIPFAPAKTMIENGLGIALASDFNPGSSPSGNMHFILKLACIKMKLLPEQAVNALTLNGAYAMELSADFGSITKGKAANFIVTKPIDHLVSLAYHFGDNLIDSVYICGKKW
ncbi:MAG: imidazolonepropionase [Chitinophagales bacterium]|nr:imidazolonepropionase [Chitinophagales bacterium]